MKRNISPSPAIGTQHKEFLAERAGDVIARLTCRLADGSRPGILTTLDDTSRPHSRRMPTIGFADFPLLYATASPGSAVLAQVGRQPSVKWMFGNDSRSVVVNLTGRARVVTDAGLINRIWKLRTERACPLNDNRQNTGFGFVLIETEVENIECNIPREEFKALTGLLACAETWHPASFHRA